MKIAGKLLIGFLSILPFFYTIIFIGSIFYLSDFFNHFDLMFDIHIAVMVLTAVLVTLFIIHLFKTDKVENDKKALWAIVLFMGGIIAFPIYWYHYIWK